MFETFEHTADLGLRVRAKDLPSLFEEAGRGLFSMIVADMATIQSKQPRVLEIAGTDRDYLLFDWLNELLYLFDTEHVVFGDFQVTLADDGLTATARGEPVDDARHRLDHEVKAITYHGLKIEHVGDGWVAEVIVDI